MISAVMVRAGRFRSVLCRRKDGSKFGPFLTDSRLSFMIFGATYVWIVGQHIFGRFQVLEFSDFQISSSRHNHEYLTYMGR